MAILACLISMTVLVSSGAQSPLSPEAGAPVISFEQAGDYIGQNCFVYGRVVQSRNIGSRCFLNFHPDYRNHFTVVINKPSFASFPEPPEKMYNGKDVKVFGRVDEYKGKPAIIVSKPDQITILTDGLPTTAARRPALPATRPPFKGVVRIATFNVLNLFDGEDDPYHDDEGTRTKPKEELAKIAATLREVDADVVALQEVENRFYLERFRDQFLGDMGYREIVLVEGNNNRGIDVALLSRFPVGPVTSYRHLRFSDGDGQPMSFRRDLLRARLEPPDVKPFDVFVVHLKSKGGGEAETLPIRLGEARQVRRIVDAILDAQPSARFVICGDFNDTIDSEPLQAIRGQGTTALRAVTDKLAATERITYNKDPYRSQIDFIWCSPGMARCYQDGSARILQGTVSSQGSDHNPVVAAFNLRSP